jgi:endonuclease/exonuclease/phosphatase family metal-dependent hydrolase
MKRILIFLFVAFAALPLSSRGRHDNSKGTLTVISYNIRNGEAEDGTNSWRFRYAASAEMIEDQQPDVFGVQEAYLYQVQFLEQYPGNYKSLGVGREDGKQDGEFMSIFYNTKTIKKIKWGTFWLSDTPEKPSKGWDGACRRTATWALLQDKRTGMKFYYVNTHLDHVGVEARRNGLNLIVDRISSINPEGYPMVLTGDFNMTPESPEFEGLRACMLDARETAGTTDHNITYNGWGRKDTQSVIDYIYYKGFSSCRSFETITKPYAGFKFISDHFPIKSVLEF